jgi:hypothetical protein
MTQAARDVTDDGNQPVGVDAEDLEQLDEQHGAHTR